jgi:hypothetical protein
MRSVDFLRVWLVGYAHPMRVVDELEGRPAPHWGLYAQLIRDLLDALLLFLPLSWMGWEPSTPSYFTVLSTERYYASLVYLGPVFVVCQWLLLGAVVHLILRLARLPSDMDQILKITGMAALVVGAVLVLWDWVWIWMGWRNIILLGISHLALDIWGIVIVGRGFRRIAGIPVWAGLALSVMYIVLAVPLAMLFMRGPF